MDLQLNKLQFPTELYIYTATHDSYLFALISTIACILRKSRLLSEDKSVI